MWLSYPPGLPQRHCCRHARLDVHHRLHLHLQGEMPSDKGPSPWDPRRNVKPAQTNQSTNQVTTCMVAPSIVLGAQLKTSSQDGRGTGGTHAMRRASVHAEGVCPRTRRRSAAIATSNAFRCSALVPNRTGNSPRPVQFQVSAVQRRSDCPADSPALPECSSRMLAAVPSGTRHGVGRARWPGNRRENTETWTAAGDWIIS